MKGQSRNSTISYATLKRRKKQARPTSKKLQVIVNDALDIKIAWDFGRNSQIKMGFNETFKVYSDRGSDAVTLMTTLTVVIFTTLL